ncbi:hypothetical protein NFI96_032269 [Prochilodus magdalenae]|nr:hypothetical protein NFI96_032269 [Prochilodus magdalenae]
MMKLFAVIAVLLLRGFCALAVDNPKQPPNNLKRIVEKTSQAERGVLEKGNAPVVGPLAPKELQERVSKSHLFGNNLNLNWTKWEGSLPNGAVSIYNGKRSDYICKYNCEAGFYTPSKGPYCNYPYGEKEYRGRKFDVLVNVDNFELLVWKDGSHGSVPNHAVRTCRGINVFVGKNKYGLGKVVPKFKSFYLPWEGKEYWYKTYQVLAINRDNYTQHISHVEYGIDELNLFHNPPETMKISRITNNDCQAVTKKMTISKTMEVQKTWNTVQSTTLSITSSVTAQIPLIGSAGVEFTTEQTLQFSKGTTIIESLSHEVSVRLMVPPNHSCSARMEGRKITADIPFKARLNRKYANGRTTWTSINGVYAGVQFGEVRAVVDRCEPIPDAKPCP